MDDARRHPPYPDHERRRAMFGPLPLLHRLLVISLSLLTGIASGAWLAHVTSLPMAVDSGAALGCLAGAMVAYTLVHDFHHQPRAVRIDRRR
jgi:hypothetical protein